MEQKNYIASLEEQRKLFLFGPVTEQSALDLVVKIMYLDSLSQEPVELYIFSPGGSVLAGATLYSAMKMVASPIHTINMGLAASMAAIILAAGDKRFVYPTAQTMIHQPLIQGGIGGQATDVSINSFELNRWKEWTIEVLTQETGLDKETIESLIERDTFLTPQEAKAYNIVDVILQPSEYANKKMVTLDDIPYDNVLRQSVPPHLKNIIFQEQVRNGENVVR